MKANDYTGQESSALLGLEGRVQYASGEEEMVGRLKKNLAVDAEQSRLSKQDIRLLLVMSTELVNLCAKLTGKIDPAAGAMLAYVRDEVAAETKSVL